MLNNKVFLTPLKRIIVPGGDVIQNIKLGDDGFNGFGETYYSFINYQQIKGWKKHFEMTLNLTCPIGKVRFIFSEDLIDFNEIILNDDNFFRITVLPGIWFAFQGLYNPTSLINNVSDIIHNPKESERKGVEDVSYKW